MLFKSCYAFYSTTTPDPPQTKDYRYSHVPTHITPAVVGFEKMYAFEDN